MQRCKFCDKEIREIWGPGLWHEVGGAADWACLQHETVHVLRGPTGGYGPHLPIVTDQEVAEAIASIQKVVR